MSAFEKITNCITTKKDWDALLPWTIDLSEIKTKKKLWLSSVKAYPSRSKSYIILDGKY